MNQTRKLGTLLLAIYLIAIGVTQFSVALLLPPFLVGALAIAAGICIILDR